MDRELRGANRSLAGQRGVFLVAAELARLELTVAPTARNVRGADLLVTTGDNRRAFSVEVKTISTRRNYWLMPAPAQMTRSRSHAFVFVDAHAAPPQFLLRRSRVAARCLRYPPPPGEGTKSKPSMRREDVERYRDAWRIFGIKEDRGDRGRARGGPEGKPPPPAVV